jgi:uncharacterized repeat protein (TIGR04076 family)
MKKTTGRRAFCRTASLAAFGAVALRGPSWAEALAQTIRLESGTGPGSKETHMDKRIKAVTAKVISVKGECGIHKVGDSCTFTVEGVQGKICIHAMYSMLPKVFALMFGAAFPWLQDPDVATHACPDAANPVVFEITRLYEE